MFKFNFISVENLKIFHLPARRKLQICYSATQEKAQLIHTFMAYNKEEIPVSVQFYGVRIHKAMKTTWWKRPKKEKYTYEYLERGKVSNVVSFPDREIRTMLNLNNKFMPKIDVGFIEPDGSLHRQKVKLYSRN